MRCQSAGEIGCLEVSAGFSFPHLYRSPDFDGRPRFATMMQFPCPRSSCPTSPIADLLHQCARARRKILWSRARYTSSKRCTNIPSPTQIVCIVSREITTGIKALAHSATFRNRNVMGDGLSSMPPNFGLMRACRMNEPFDDCACDIGASLRLARRVFNTFETCQRPLKRSAREGRPEVICTPSKRRE